MNTDRIEKKVQLNASRERVWHAVSDATQFGRWFGVKFEGAFEEGKSLRGKITPTEVDEAVAAMQKPHEGMAFEWVVERIEPQQRIVFRWHPFAIDKAVDYSAEPMTTIVFELDDSDGGTLLTITESGFDAIPAARRAQAYEANAGGWAHQLRLVEKFLALTASPKS
jgi:uncharacterized protein YndB with AHSA1/START domain